MPTCAFFELVEKDGIDCVRFVDEKRLRVLGIWITSIRDFDGKPIVPMTYSVVNGTTEKILKDRVSKLFNTKKGHTEMALTIVEQRLLEIYLADNQTNLSSWYDPGELEDDDEYTFSFILPLGPVAPEDLQWICQRNRCSRCEKTMGPEAFPYIYSNAQYCSQQCENKSAELYLRINKPEKAGRDSQIPMFLPSGRLNPSYELEEAYFENGFVDPEEELQRDDLIYILRGMKINIPPWTRLSARKLEARLKLALDAAQRYPDLFLDAGRVELDQFPRWDEKASSLSKAFDLPERNSFTTLQDNGEMTMTSVCGYLSRFIKCIDETGADTAIFDSENHRVLVVKVIRVYAINKETIPLFLVAFKVIQGLCRQQDILEEVYSEKGPKGIIFIPMPQLEQQLLEFYLEHNHDRLLANRTIPESVMLPVNKLSNQGYNFGFILPLGDISSKELRGLNESAGCRLCGEKTKSKCAACKNVEYCGKACQTADWKKHKPFCHAITSGLWHRIELSPKPPSVQRASSKPGSDPVVERPPENPYSDNYHVLKFERPTGTKGPASKQVILVSDVVKSFTLYCYGADNGMVFEDVVDTFDKNVDRKVMYRWAKRVGDWEWKTCLKCVPDGLRTW